MQRLSHQCSVSNLHEYSKYFIITNICIHIMTESKLAGRMRPTFCSMKQLNFIVPSIQWMCSILFFIFFCVVLCYHTMETYGEKRKIGECVSEWSETTQRIGKKGKSIFWNKMHLESTWEFDGRNNTDNELELEKWTCMKYCVFFVWIFS